MVGDFIEMYCMALTKHIHTTPPQKTAVTLSCLYQVASDDALCRFPFSKLRKPEEKQQQQQQQQQPEEAVVG